MDNLNNLREKLIDELVAMGLKPRNLFWPLTASREWTRPIVIILSIAATFIVETTLVTAIHLDQ